MDSMVKTIKIGNKTIGEKQPTFIIAEAGVNHNGRLDLAKKLVDIAAHSGVDAVKFQTYKAEGVVASNVDSAEYVSKNMGKPVDQLKMIKNYELNYEDFKKIKQYCDQKNIIFLSTPHSFDAIDFLDELVPAFKIGSGDITNIPMLKHVAKKDKPIILGTGMSTLSEVQNAIDTVRKHDNNEIIALHCTTNYPCPLEEVNLHAMITMQKRLNCLVGFSDHTLSTTVPALAVALGAVIIEKHFTTSKKLEGPDHRASLEPDELKQMINEIRNTEKTLGSFDKKPTFSEEKIMSLVRKSIIATQNIEKGTIINKDMITIKRPGTGLPPSDYEKIIGKKTNQTISKDEIIKPEMIK